MKSWLIFRHSRIALQFKYPRQTINGEPVVRLESEQAGAFRVHILAPTSREVYFEVTRYPELSAQSEYQQHMESLSKQFNSLAITELIETVCASHPAHEYTFEWESGIRTVLLLESDEETYRILYDPRFPVNLHILSSVEWITSP